MAEPDLREQLICSWVALNGMLKDSQMTKGLTYNESIVMLLVYDSYRRDPEGKVSIQSLLKSTRMLKSLMNRTVNSLCERGFLRKEYAGRSLYVTVCPDRLSDFLQVHNRSLVIAQQIIDLIGQDDAADFIRICSKLQQSELTISLQGE